MYVGSPHKAEVSEPTFFADRLKTEPRLYFGVVMPAGFIARFEPVLDYSKDDDEIYVTEIAITHGVFRCSPDEFAAVAEIYRRYEEAITAYLHLCHFAQIGPIDYEALKLATTFPLNRAERASIEAELKRFTYIYVIRDRATGYVKIGKSNNPAKRLQELKRQPTLLPTENDFHILFFARYYDYIERAYHKKFDAKRVRGEWFRLTDEEITQLRKELNVYSHGTLTDCF